ncbi:MAG: helix-turn-helix domain-containing protein [Proteobacteria bacterium]|nr:helix-turn-helix domain-containing protein [Pseudomonadota bacterium]
MPLDTGAVTDFDVAGAGSAMGSPGSARRSQRVILEGDNIGQSLRMIREARGLSIDAVAEMTRIRPSYIAAIEASDMASLPSRPFAIGYVRAYAQALDLDADSVVARFKAEAPEHDASLRTPVGVRHNMPRRFGPMAGVAAALMIALIGWNVARHAMAQNEAGQPRQVRQVPVAQIKPATGVVSLGAPLPPPPEATTPKPYVPPGMLDQGAPAASPAAIAAQAAADANAPPIGSPFIQAGKIYGDPTPGPGLILQATKGTTLTVHGAGGAIYFTAFLKAGEAWRAPAQVKGLAVDVGAPAAVSAYVAGVSRGPLKDPTTSLAQYGS